MFPELQWVETTGMKYYLFLIVFCCGLAGCGIPQEWLPAVTVNVESVREEDAAFLVCLDNQSSYTLKLTYPASSGFISPGQSVFLRMGEAGNHKLVITAYLSDKDRGNVYEPLATTEMPVFLDGKNLVSTQGKFVGALVTVTDGMFSSVNPNESHRDKHPKGK